MKLFLCNKKLNTLQSPSKKLKSPCDLNPNVCLYISHQTSRRVQKMNPDSSVVKTRVAYFESLADQGRNKPSEADDEVGGVMGSDDAIYDGAFAMGDLAEALQEDADEAAIVVNEAPKQAVFAMGKANPKPKVKKVKQGPKRAYSISSVNQKNRNEKSALTKLKKRLDKLNRTLDALAAEVLRAKDDEDEPYHEAMLALYRPMEAEAEKISLKIAKLSPQIDVRVSAQERAKAFLKSLNK